MIVLADAAQIERQIVGADYDAVDPGDAGDGCGVGNAGLRFNLGEKDGFPVGFFQIGAGVSGAVIRMRALQRDAAFPLRRIFGERYKLLRLLARFGHGQQKAGGAHVQVFLNVFPAGQRNADDGKQAAEAGDRYKVCRGSVVKISVFAVEDQKVKPAGAKDPGEIGGIQLGEHGSQNAALSCFF